MYFYDIFQNILEAEVRRENLWSIRYSKRKKKHDFLEMASTAKWVRWVFVVPEGALFRAQLPELV